MQVWKFMYCFDVKDLLNGYGESNQSTFKHVEVTKMNTEEEITLQTGCCHRVCWNRWWSYQWQYRPSLIRFIKYNMMEVVLGRDAALPYA